MSRTHSHMEPTPTCKIKDILHSILSIFAEYQHEAYRKFHSTKTALLKIHNDILSSMDDGRVTALTLLDLSSAFDTINHTILLRRLGNWFGMSGKALDWFKSYLTGRKKSEDQARQLSVLQI